MNFYIENPYTGRMIKVGGPTYKSLEAQGVEFDTSSLIQKADPNRPTRGWKASSPRTKVERRLMREKCGEECFLNPSELKFPICDLETCKVDCRGALAAKVRAAQFHYDDILEKAEKIVQKCRKTTPR